MSQKYTLSKQVKALIQNYEFHIKEINQMIPLFEKQRDERQKQIDECKTELNQSIEKLEHLKNELNYSCVLCGFDKVYNTKIYRFVCPNWMNHN